MLIRMQDRTEIINFDHIVCFKAENNGTVRMLIKDGVYTAGEYGAKEKAIKVIDMIQNAYEGSFDRKNSQDEIISSHSQVFQMPTDEEVDELTAQDIIDNVMKM